MGKFKVGGKVIVYDGLERFTGKVTEIDASDNTLTIQNNFAWFSFKQCRRPVKKKKCPGEFEYLDEYCKKCGVTISKHPLPVTVNNVEWPQCYLSPEGDIEKLSHRIDALTDGFELLRRGAERFEEEVKKNKEALISLDSRLRRTLFCSACGGWQTSGFEECRACNGTGVK